MLSINSKHSANHMSDKNSTQGNNSDDNNENSSYSKNITKTDGNNIDKVTDIIDSFYVNKKTSFEKNLIEKDQSLENNKMTFNVTKVVKIDEQEEGILASFNKKQERFSFHDKNRKILGSFTVPHLIKYIGKTHDNNFMHIQDDAEYDTSVFVIKAFIVTCDQMMNTLNNIQDAITLKDHNTSPFMGDIEMLIMLNNLMHSFEKRRLDGELMLIDEKHRKRAYLIIKNFIYSILKHTLKVLSIVSTKIKYDDSKKKLKENIMKYTAGIVFRITSFVKDQLNALNDSNQALEKTLNLCSNLRQKANINISSLFQKMIEQNKYLSEVESKLDECKHKLVNYTQRGGDESISSEKSKSGTESKSILNSNSNSNVVSLSSDTKTDTLNKTNESNSDVNYSEEIKNTTIKGKNSSHFSGIYDI